MLADVFEAEVEFAYGILLHSGRNADPAGFGQRFQPRRNIDAVAKDIAIFGDDIADVDANAKFDPIVAGDRHIAFSHCSLYRGCAAQCIDHTGEFDQ